MPTTYRRPGVYLEESLLVNQATTSASFTVAAFIGVAEKGPVNEPTRVDSWSDFVTMFGGFSPITPPAPATTQVLSYLPFSVYSFFQSGGRTAWIIRSVSATSGEEGDPSSVDVNGALDTEDPLTSFVVSALSVGSWGNTIKYSLGTQSTVGSGDTAQDVFVLQILVTNSDGVDEVVETFPGLSISGSVPGTRRVDVAVNDPAAGSQYVTISDANEVQGQPLPTTSPVALAGGTDPGIPDAAALMGSAQQVSKVEGPVVVGIVGYHSDLSKINTSESAASWVGTTVPSTAWTDRQDIFVVNDSAPPRLPNQTSAAYKSTIQTSLGVNPGDSYSASYGPWILIPHPQKIGQVVAVPPGGGLMGVMSRIDATVGVFRAPAGVIAAITNAVGVQTKFSDTELGDLNSVNINIIRSVPGAGICVMGARTRKSFGADHYVSARRTLIYIKESLRQTTQFAVFENNDQRLWSSLRMSADRILRPLWEAGGLKGANAAEAYFIRCDDTLNTGSVIASGEVRMEVGVALQYPAEFVIIRLTQFDQGSFTSEVSPAN
jgi:phage tail sheath protein FI